MTRHLRYVLLLAFAAVPACARYEGTNPGNESEDMAFPGGPVVCVDPGDCPDRDMSQPKHDLATPPADLATPTTPPPGPTCSAQTFPLTITKSAPNIHLVIDRSGSMSLDSSGNVPTGTQTAKWEDLSTSLNSILTSYGNQANAWGMSLFPTDTTYHSCVAGNIAVGLAPPATSVPAIKSAIAVYNRTNLLTYNGYTPTEQAIQGVIDHVPLSDASRNNYVVLMTDGLPKCAPGFTQDVTSKIAALYAQNPPVRTFVIGFGSELVPDPIASQATNPALLNDWATAGHTAIAGATKYYQASNAAALSTAFTDIVSGVASCTFNLSTNPSNPSLVVGTLNGMPIASDVTNGFTYDVGTNSITFHGASCNVIKTSPTTTSVSAVYGCPAGTI
jgi:hypothetical protein